MKIDIMTLFPEMINAVMRESIIGRAQDRVLSRSRQPTSAIMRSTSITRRMTRPMAADADRSCWLSRCICAIRR